MVHMSNSNAGEDREFYLEVIRSVIDQFSKMLGEKVAYKYARKAPLEITPDGEVTDCYGSGKNALETLVKQYEKVWGRKVARGKVKDAIHGSVPEEKYEMLPDYMVPSEEEGGMLDGIMDRLRG